MQRLENLYENISKEAHKDFRLILTLSPFNEFPI